MKKDELINALKQQIPPLEETAIGELRGGFSSSLNAPDDFPDPNSNIGCNHNDACYDNITCFGNGKCSGNGPCHNNQLTCSGNTLCFNKG